MNRRTSQDYRDRYNAETVVELACKKLSVRRMTAILTPGRNRLAVWAGCARNEF